MYSKQFLTTCQCKSMLKIAQQLSNFLKKIRAVGGSKRERLRCGLRSEYSDLRMQSISPVRLLVEIRLIMDQQVVQVQKDEESCAKCTMIPKLTSKLPRSGISSNNSSGLQCLKSQAAEWTRGVCVHSEPRHYTMILDRRLQQPIS